MATFNYPDNYLTLLNYFRTLPLLTAFSAFSMGILFLFLLADKSKYPKIRFLTGMLVFLALLSAVPKLPYQETRYTFFIVPLLIILVNYSIYLLFDKLIRRGVITKCFLCGRYFICILHFKRFQCLSSNQY